jgi:osmotically inducible lipoprotein OsmB
MLAFTPRRLSPSVRAVAAAALLAGAAAGCSGTERTISGAAIGGAVGGVAGAALTGTWVGAGVGAAAGAAVGGLVGNATQPRRRDDY